MKKNLLILTFSCFLVSLTHAQIKKDSWLLGGQISFGSQKTTDGNFTTKANGTGLVFSLGKAYRDNHVFGGQVSAGFSDVDFFNGTETDNQKSKSFGVGGFYRIYKPLGKEFYFFGQGNADLRWGNGKVTSPSAIDNREFRNISGTISVTPGIAYAVVPKFHVELTLPALFGISYDRATTEFPNANSPEQVTTSVNAFTSIGPGTQAGLLGVGFRLIL